jgi:hypothetical protein
MPSALALSSAELELSASTLLLARAAVRQLVSDIKSQLPDSRSPSHRSLPIWLILLG